MRTLYETRLDAGWQCEERDGALVCRAAFWLDPLDVCARYLLHVEGAERAYRLVLRGLAVDGHVGDLLLDVTEHVMLEDNTLEMMWSGTSLSANPPLQALTLRAVPCEEADAGL
ncbi:MAG: hypothetical protein DIU68_008595 [Chloroflexota bacterium]|mgnify:CR=1 FL=1